MALTAVPDPKPARPWVAHKFGGTSVADADRIAAVARLLLARADSERQVVVVSAMKGATDALLDLAARAAARDPSWRERAEALARRHREAAHALLGSRETALHAEIEAEFTGLGELLHAMALLGTAPGAASDFVAGLGEVLSARLLVAHLRHLGRSVEMLDAREVLVVRHGELGAAVEWPETERRLADWRAHHPADCIVVTGFIARDRDGHATTLGRNGSDYSGAIFGALFDAAAIEIWTDVDGVLSADPRLVPEAELVPELTYAEACELAYFGAKVIHPQTMQPAIARGIPIRIRNTFNPAHPGSLIRASASREPPVKGVTAIGDLAIVSVEGTGMIGVPGTAERVFSALHRAGISVVMISQGSSEHSICCAVSARESRRAVEELREAFARELERGQIEAVAAEPGIGVLAIVGEGMAGTPGVAARLFDALARAGINVRAIAQGASERNISVAIAERDVPRALRAAHAGFWLSALTLSVGVVGPGLVGSALVEQLRAAAPRLRESANLDLRVRAIANSRHLLTDDRALDLSDWRAALAGAPPGDLERFAAHVAAPHLPHAVIIDCSASSAVADRYAEWLAAGIHVITPNKQAGSGPRARYAAIRDAQRARGARFRYEATVGAGLPVISTLRDLVDTGDEILAVEGIFSGTLAYLFNRYDGREPFSALVADARARGYTEPDPRDDLSGIDVGRKLAILAREIGMDLELDEVAIESLVPAALAGVGKDEFLARLAELDAPMAARLDAARASGQVLRYVARLDVAAGRASVGLVALPGDHAFAHIRLTDNVVQFTTRRYRDNPLVVQGPGAGPEVTAAGVFADLLRVAAALGARI
jgi:aspartokinase/homoserine dehydrogenase 1